METEVRLISNPLKCLKAKGTINKYNNQISVPFLPDYMNLSMGIWSVCLDTYLFKVNSAGQLETVYEVSSNLVTGYAVNSATNDRVSNFIPLGHFYAVAPSGMFYFGQFDRKWFQINERFGHEFNVHFNQLPLIQNVDNDIEIEFTILFQRLR